MAEAFLDFDRRAFGLVKAAIGDRLEESFEDVRREQLGGGVGDRQEDAIARGKAPTIVFVANLDLFSRAFDSNQAVLGGKEHTVIEFVDDLAGEVFEQDEIGDVMILVEFVFDLDRRPVIMAVESFATVSRICDEMTRAEDKIIFCHADAITHRGCRSSRYERKLFQPFRLFSSGGNRSSRHFV